MQNKEHSLKTYWTIHSLSLFLTNMCLKNLKGVGEHTFSCLIATIDLVMDCINGLELLGFINPDFFNNNEEKSVQKIWGSLSLFIIFLPGILIAIPQVLESLFRKQYLDAISSFFLMLIFPLLFPAFQVMKIMQILSTCRWKNSKDKSNHNHNLLTLNDMPGSLMF